MAPHVLLPILVIYGFLLGHSASANTSNVFYVLGSDGIDVIDPEKKSIVAKINDTTSPGLCTKRYSRDCSLRQACVVDDAVLVIDIFGVGLHVIDTRTHAKIKTIPLGDIPVALYCFAWRKEVWVQFYPNPHSFQVIKTEGFTWTRVIQAELKSVTYSNEMLADQDMLEGKTAFVTDNRNPGIHELNLQTKNYISFRNFSRYGCTKTYRMAYNSYNKHLYVSCLSSIIEVDTVSENTKTWRFYGLAYVSPDGRYVVFVYQSGSRIKVLAVNGTGFNAIDYPELSFPGDVSNPVFYPKGKTSKSYYVFFTLDRANKMAVVDLDLAKIGDISDVKYIENVDYQRSLYTWVWRELFIADKWIISVASKNKTATIINADTQKIHAKINGVNEGNFALWVPGRSIPSWTSVRTSFVTSRSTSNVISSSTSNENRRLTASGSSQNTISMTTGPTRGESPRPTTTGFSQNTISVASGPTRGESPRPTTTGFSQNTISVASAPTRGESPRPTTTGFSQNTISVVSRPTRGESTRPTTDGSCQNTNGGNFSISRPSCLIFLVVLYFSI